MSEYLSGNWTNAFGSTMSLVVEDSLIVGTYSSHTGSTGEYLLVGSCSHDNPSKELGQNIAISIYWKSIKEGVPDESWHWSGSLCGQLQFDGQLTLTNSIVVSVPLESYQKGNFIEELVFTKVNDLEQPNLLAIKHHFPAEILEVESNSYPILGQWTDPNNPITLNIDRVDSASGLTQATLTTPEIKIPLLGFMDIDAQINMAQSVSLSGYNRLTNEAFSMSGMLDFGQNHLTLYSWIIQQTSPETSYMQTRMTSITLNKD